eukprot:gb/GECH01004273.1/.p1 GENE.gb/GECH01004273.1/~~gb/GECH01004273.1/.p1  ORF type:complete len:134 (+),score=37.06 gb/GECH01004273.1/:1-402(+)
MPEKIKKSEDEWKNQLTSEEYEVARKGGTERPFSGRYWDNKKKGVYECVCCGTPLFSSDTKYESGTGWPSFYAPVDESNVETKTDSSLGMKRTEIVCSKCDCHLGHVFDDGPTDTTGKRYCTNSCSLKFKDQE